MNVAEGCATADTMMKTNALVLGLVLALGITSPAATEFAPLSTAKVGAARNVPSP